MTALGTSDEYVFTVGELNQQVKRLLEGEFPSILIYGELSNFSKPRSGHWYFSLKDAQGQIRGAMFKFRNQHCKFVPQDGDQVIVRAKLSLYAPRGDYQLIVDALQPAGTGALQAAFDALKQKLLTEGLFDPARKKPLPLWPKGLCVITSNTGAALQDILHVLERRFPALPVFVIPVPVQGAESAPAIKHALTQADKHRESDVILLARGGGSLEDLWSFNEEQVARAIFRCRKPVVSGVGHETDFTIADFVADIRAPTPSAAAELISPDQAQVRALVLALFEQALHLIQNQLRTHKQHVALLRAHLKHPREKLLETQQTLDQLDLRLQGAWQQHLHMAHTQLQTLAMRLNQQHPKHALDTSQIIANALQKRLLQAMDNILKHRQTALKHLSQQAHLVSPLATLNRGYSITTITESDNQNSKQSKRLLRSTSQIQVGDTLHTTLQSGSVLSTVTQRIED